MNIISSQLLNKIHTRGIAWFLSRLLQESENNISWLGKVIRPLIICCYWSIFKPINTFQHLSTSEKKIYANRLFLFYDLEVSPITFDFAWALALAESYRKKIGLSFIQVVFVPGKKEGLREEDPAYEAEVNRFARFWRCHELLYAMCHLLPTCVGVTLCATRTEALDWYAKAKSHIFPEKYNVIFPVAHSTSHLLRQKDNHTAMALRATVQALKYIDQWLRVRLHNRKLITVTLRQSSYTPLRNSNLAAWAAFAEQLNPKHFLVVFVPDTDLALEGVPQVLSDFIFFNEAGWNLNLRAALYEKSYLNLGVNNGPMALCWLNERCRYITFKMLLPGVPHAMESSFQAHGFEIGRSLPFANEFQKWVWEMDDQDVILREFNDMCQRIEGKVLANSCNI